MQVYTHNAKHLIHSFCLNFYFLYLRDKCARTPCWDRKGSKLQLYWECKTTQLWFYILVSLFNHTLIPLVNVFYLHGHMWCFLFTEQTAAVFKSKKNDTTVAPPGWALLNANTGLLIQLIYLIWSNGRKERQQMLNTSSLLTAISLPLL